MSALSRHEALRVDRDTRVLTECLSNSASAGDARRREVIVDVASTCARDVSDAAVSSNRSLSETFQLQKRGIR